MSEFPTNTYKGPNKSHKKFRGEYNYLNALYYLVISCRSNLEEKLNDDLKKPGIAVGVVTHPISNTQFQGVFVHNEDAKEMAENFDAFIEMFQKQTIVSTYRVLVTYLSDFLLELSECNLVSLDTDMLRRLREGFVSSKFIATLYDDLGIPIANSGHERDLFGALVATRNVVEHNNGKVNNEYLRITKSALEVGSDAPTGSKEVGEALAIAECLSDSVNKRGLERWPEIAKLESA